MDQDSDVSAVSKRVIGIRASVMVRGCLRVQGIKHRAFETLNKHRVDRSVHQCQLSQYWFGANATKHYSQFIAALHS